MLKNKTVAVVVPTRNESKNLKHILPNIKKLTFVDEFIVMDGHSTDKTRDIAKGYGFRVGLDGGKGKGDGLRTAGKFAKSDILVFIDADGSHDPADIIKLVTPIVEKNYDIVVGSRMRGGSDELNGTVMNTLHLFFGEIIGTIINLAYKKNFTEYQNGFRAIKRKVLNRLNLKENIFTIEQEMCIKILRNGYKMHEVPAHEYSRGKGKSGISIWKMGWRYAYTVFRYIWFK